jgi:hypothetical protein
MYENRQFAIFSTTELPLMNFSEVLETSADTCRVSTDGTTDFYITKTIVVPADATQIISSKDTYFYLEEGDSIRALASAAGDLELVIGYEEIA